MIQVFVHLISSAPGLHYRFWRPL